MLKSDKRSAFSLQIRQRQKHKKITTARLKFSKQMKCEIIEQLCTSANNKNLENISDEQLDVLIKWGIEGDDNAVVCIGNLILEGVIQVQRVQCRDNWIGQNVHYLWLMHLFYEKGLFGSEELQKLLVLLCKQLTKQKCLNLSISSMIYQHGLLLVRAVIKQHSSAIDMILFEGKSQDLLKRLIWLSCEGSNNTVCNTSFSLLNIMAGHSSQLVSVINEKQIMQIFSAGILKNQAKTRCLAYQFTNNIIVTNCNLNKELLKYFLSQCLIHLSKQKPCCQLEISYLLISLVNQMTNLDLLNCIIADQPIFVIQYTLQQSLSLEINHNLYDFLNILQQKIMQIKEDIEENLSKMKQIQERQRIGNILIQLLGLNIQEWFLKNSSSLLGTKQLI